MAAQGYEVRVFNLIDPSQSDGYNPFSYIHSEKDVLTLIDNLIKNTTPRNASSNDPFWEKAEIALDSALMLYLVSEAPPEEQNFEMLIYMMNFAEVREEDDQYRSPLDMLFRALEEEQPNHVAVKQYKAFKQAAGVVCSKRLLNQAVGKSLRTHNLKSKKGAYAKHDRSEFIRVVQEAQSSQQTAEVRKQRTRLATAKQRVSELEVLLCKIYEDNILGKLSDSRYEMLDAQYEKEQSELTAEISVLEKAVKSYEKHEKDADRFIALIDKYENFDKLTIAMLNEFIEKILVHERDRKGSIQTTQEVEIYFNFVGRFVPPAFGEVELTPEELEEIRKREERKDRLHQNYLKRKASGAQKRYEDKIKERKKAEIEAKKAAIRAEDIAKGVFVPVSSLPQREPMKGVQSA